MFAGWPMDTPFIRFAYFLVKPKYVVNAKKILARLVCV